MTRADDLGDNAALTPNDALGDVHNLSVGEMHELADRLANYVNGESKLNWGDEYLAAKVIRSLIDERGRAEALSENWRNDSREETELHLAAENKLSRLRALSSRHKKDSRTFHAGADFILEAETTK